VQILQRSGDAGHEPDRHIFCYRDQSDSRFVPTEEVTLDLNKDQFNELLLQMFDKRKAGMRLQSHRCHLSGRGTSGSDTLDNLIRRVSE
jgi:hypothetical protein